MFPLAPLAKSYAREAVGYRRGPGSVYPDVISLHHITFRTRITDEHALKIAPGNNIAIARHGATDDIGVRAAFKSQRI